MEMMVGEGRVCGELIKGFNVLGEARKMSSVKLGEPYTKRDISRANGFPVYLHPLPWQPRTEKKRPVNRTVFNLLVKDVHLRTVYVSEFMAWMSSAFAARWEPYVLLSNNCQHFQAELQAGGLGAAKSHSRRFSSTRRETWRGAARISSTARWRWRI